MSPHISSPVVIDVVWQRQATDTTELFLSAFMLNADGKVRDIKDIVYYGTLEQNQRGVVSVDESIVLSATLQMKQVHGENVVSHNMVVELERIDPNIKRVVFVVSTDSENGLDSYTNATFAMSFGKEKATPIELAENGDEAIKCLIVGYIERHNASWRFFEEGTAFNGTLEEAYNEYATTDIRRKYPYDKFFSREWLQKEQEIAQIIRNIKEAENNYDFSSVVKYCDELIQLEHSDDTILRAKKTAIKKISSIQKYLQEADSFVKKGLWTSAKNSAELALNIAPNLEDAIRIQKISQSHIMTTQKIEMFWQQAETAFRNKEYKKSTLSLNEVLAIDEKNVKAINLLGKIKMAESSSKHTLKSLISQLDVAKRTKDYEHALEICNSIMILDKTNSTKWQKEIENLNGQLRLMSGRTIRKEFADIKAMIRSNEMDDARIKLLQLRQGLHALGNHEHDSSFAELLNKVTLDETPKAKEPEAKEPKPQKTERSSQKQKDNEALMYLKAKDFRKAKATFARKQESEMAQICTEIITKSKVLIQAKELVAKVTEINKKRFRADIKNIVTQLSELKSMYLTYEIPTDDIDALIIKINNIV